jgi:hypothetical protein
MHALIDPQEKYKTDTPSGWLMVVGVPSTIYAGQPRGTD